MNIAFVGPFGLQPKGTMRVRALPLARALVARGHAVTVLIPPWDDPQRAGQSWQDEGVNVINVSLPLGLPLLFHLLLTLTLLKQLWHLKPEVIHFFKPKAYAGLTHFALWWWRRLGGKRVRFVLDCDDWEQAWNEISDYSAAQKRFFSWQEQWGLAHADVVTLASRALEPLTAAYTSPTSVVYLPNGYQPQPHDLAPAVPSEHVDRLRQAWDVEQTQVILLYTRFWEFRLARLVALVDYVAQHRPQARWLMVGEGLQGEEKDLAAHLQEAGLLQVVRFTGWPVENLPAYFALADVAVHPFDETLINRTKCSVKVIELLANGLPLVVDAVGQNCEYIETEQSGLLIPPEDDVAFGQAIVRLLAEPDTRSRLGQTAAQRIREKYSWTTLSQIAEEVYS